MDLFDEEMLSSNNKTRKEGKKLIRISIIVLIILCLFIIGLLIYIKASIINVSIDGVANNELRNILNTEEDNNKVYVPIRKFANLLAYDSYNGEYLNPSEDTTKCYIKSDNEVANISLNSNIIRKKELSDTSIYEKVELEEPIKEINGELYTNIDGIEKIFNVEFVYDIENKNIAVYTLPYLVDYYSKKLSTYGYSELKEGFANQKAILKDILIAKDSNGNYGVIQISSGKNILEPKYNDIEYLKNTNDFLVTSNGNKGIISHDRKIKVDIEYQEINEINEELYKVKKGDKIGIITKLGKNVIYPKYDYIGFEKNEFEEINGENIFLTDLIPVKEDEKWAVFNTKGEQLTEFIYDSLGCIIKNDDEKENVIIIDGYDVFVVEKENKYYLVTKNGKNVIDYGFDLIYKIDNEGKDEYYMTYNSNKTVNVAEWLEKIGIKNKNK